MDSDLAPILTIKNAVFGVRFSMTGFSWFMVKWIDCVVFFVVITLMITMVISSMIKTSRVLGNICDLNTIVMLKLV